MSPGATYERVYRALKEQLVLGTLLPGQHLEPAALSQQLNSSITPVRDALHRLAGERLVQTPRNNGFQVPMFTEAALRDLYGWNLQLLLLALRSAGSRNCRDAPPTEGAEADAAARASALFIEIARLTASPEHVSAVAGLNDRLRPIRRAEIPLIGNTEEELTEISLALQRHHWAALRKILSAYHRRRASMVAEILTVLQPLP